MEVLWTHVFYGLNFEHKTDVLRLELRRQMTNA